MMNRLNERSKLERLFHEPARLSIMSMLCAAEKAMLFTELRDTCGLTDGNLNRHLKVLSEDDIVVVTKRFVDGKPQTSLKVTPEGLARFGAYLEALESVLAGAREALREQEAGNGLKAPSAVTA